MPFCKHKYEQQKIGYIEKNLNTIYFDSFDLNCEPKLNATQFVEFTLRKPSILNDSLSLQRIFVREQILLIDEITFVNLKGIDIGIKRPLIEKNIMLEFECENTLRRNKWSHIQKSKLSKSNLSFNIY